MTRLYPQHALDELTPDDKERKLLGPIVALRLEGAGVRTQPGVPRKRTKPLSERVDMVEPGWYAVTADENQAEDNDHPGRPRDGDVIIFMSDDSIDVPLWDEDGTLLFADRDELISEWQFSEKLADEIVDWAHVDQAGPRMDAEAARLIDLLKRETESRFRFVYNA